MSWNPVVDEPGPFHPSAPIRARPYQPGDRDFVLGLASRLTIGIAPWRDVEPMRAAMHRFIAESAATAEATSAVTPTAAMFVAEDARATPLGFVTIARQVNFTGELQAYIGELAVREAAEGVGAGRTLLRAAEDWAREHGFRLVVLDTGTANTHARAFYVRQGYGEESVRLVKVL